MKFFSFLCYSVAAMATLYILEYRSKGAVHGPYYVLPVNHVSPTTNLVQHHPQGSPTNMIPPYPISQHSSNPIPNPVVSVDTVPSQHNAIYPATSQEKHQSKGNFT
jgi:hypothetical protein